jgi:hypothetical protein
MIDISPLEIIRERLPIIFPEGTPNRNYCTRDITVKTIFVMLYVDAVQDTDTYITPMHVCRMTDEQASKTSLTDRKDYHKCVLKRGCTVSGSNWYQDNTRESIRDETLKDALVQLGAVIVKSGVPTTSSKPRYALQRGFAELFNADLESDGLSMAIEEWQDSNLSVSGLARIKLNLRTANLSEKILVTFPNKETRHLEAGPSSSISKSVIEVFTKHFLIQPFVLWLSESGNKVTHRDDELARSLGINIDAQTNLPDIILVDIHPKDPLIIFVEVVATDGAITPRRVSELLKITSASGYKDSQVLFVSAYSDRQSAGFKKTISDLGWNSFVWFASEPENIFILHEGAMNLADIIQKLKSEE